MLCLSFCMTSKVVENSWRVPRKIPNYSVFDVVTSPFRQFLLALRVIGANDDILCELSSKILD